MSDEINRDVPHRRDYDPFFEPSLSMSGGMEEARLDALAFLVERGLGAKFSDDVPLILSTNGTDVAAALEAAALFEPDESRFERFQLVITDGDPDPMAGVNGETVEQLVERLGIASPVFICLDESGARDTIAAHDRDRPRADGMVHVDELEHLPHAMTTRFAAAGIGLAPVPSASELVGRCCASVDDNANAFRQEIERGDVVDLNSPEGERFRADVLTAVDAFKREQGSGDKCCGCGGCDEQSK